ncbi:MAG: adenylate/guanylate cyclase domain-containing response regulator [Magnetococcales bacterium]|nr:adenylate/guanylate cyclase domain-containing response regulator [Magnetococcales bacterium]
MRETLNSKNPSWEILTAQGEAEGLQCLQDQLQKGQPVDVVITDLVMEHETSGMSVLQRSRQLDPQVMTILFTAREQSLDRYRAFELGAFDVVEKTIRGQSAIREINVKTRAALGYKAWSQHIAYLRRYFDPRLFETIERDPSLLKDDRKVVTICFWDIRGFSRLCESLKAHPRLISAFLREYSELGAKTIFAHDGLLDKFIGDGIMALFGVLNHKDDEGRSDAKSAVQAARQLREAFEKLLPIWMERWSLYTADRIDIGLGCGIHTGEVIVGNVGTTFRDQFTALGPPVNFASRIEARARSGQILLSQSTLARVQETIACQPAGEISDIKNIPGTFPLYEVL